MLYRVLYTYILSDCQKYGYYHFLMSRVGVMTLVLSVIQVSNTIGAIAKPCKPAFPFAAIVQWNSS